MRVAIVLAGLLATGPAWAGADNMAGWYIVKVNPDARKSGGDCREVLHRPPGVIDRARERCVGLENFDSVNK